MVGGTENRDAPSGSVGRGAAVLEESCSGRGGLSIRVSAGTPGSIGMAVVWPGELRVDCWPWSIGSDCDSIGDPLNEDIPSD